jgi:hypothetical protein
MKHKSDFVEDRLFNAVPDIHAPLEEKYAYQAELRKRWEAMGDKPSAILDFPLPDPDKFWTDPYGIDPEQHRRRLNKQINQYTKR